MFVVCTGGLWKAVKYIDSELCGGATKHHRYDMCSVELPAGGVLAVNNCQAQAGSEANNCAMWGRILVLPVMFRNAIYSSVHRNVTTVAHMDDQKVETELNAEGRPTRVCMSAATPSSRGRPANLARPTTLETEVWPQQNCSQVTP